MLSKSLLVLITVSVFFIHEAVAQQGENSPFVKHALQKLAATSTAADKAGQPEYFSSPLYQPAYSLTAPPWNLQASTNKAAKYEQAEENAFLKVPATPPIQDFTRNQDMLNRRPIVPPVSNAPNPLLLMLYEALK